MKYEAPKATVVDFKTEYVMAGKTFTGCGTDYDDNGKVGSWNDFVGYLKDIFD
jgi:hypothetical protein